MPQALRQDAEGFSMSDESKPVLALHGTAVEHASRFIPFIKAAVLAVSVAAAIPTAQNLYYSWKNGIPFDQVSHRLAQYDLWMKNLDCKIDYRSLATASGTRVDVGACQKTGDIAIKVSGTGGHSAYEWIDFDQIKKATPVASLMQLLVTPAYAAESAELLRAAAGQAAAKGQPAATPLPAGAYRVAEGMETMCQAKRGDKIVRIVKDAGKCFKEVVSPLKGGVESRSEVSCSSSC